MTTGEADFVSQMFSLFSLKERADETDDPATWGRVAEAAMSVAAQAGPGTEEAVMTRVLAWRAHMRRFEITHDLRDARRGAAVARELVRAEPANAEHHLYLVESLRMIDEQSGDVDDIDATVEAARTLISKAAIPWAGSTLGCALRRRYARTGREADLHEAITHHRWSVDVAEPGAEETPELLGNLARAMDERFQRFHAAGDLDAAEAATERAMALLPEGSPLLGAMLVNLAMYRHTRFLYLHDPSALDDAVKLGLLAVAIIGSPDDGHIEAQANLAGALDDRAMLAPERSPGVEADLAEAVRRTREVVESLPPGRPGGRKHRSNLAMYLLHQRQHLDEATGLIEGVLAETAADDPSRATYLAVLAEILDQRTDVPELTTDIWREASQLPVASIEFRLFATSRWAEAAARSASAATMLAAYTQATDLLQLLIWTGQIREDSERQLAERSGLATDAVAAAVRAGDCPAGLALAEQGRGVLWTRRLNARGDLGGLTAASPGLAERLVGLRAELEGLGPAAVRARRR
ncbi:hypothetical protein ACQPZJ_22275 [Actinoplanes sp. CA-054009]